MPIYEYICERCNNLFEEFEFSSHSDEKAACPKCGSTETKRVLSSISSGRSSSDSGSLSSDACGPGGGGGFS